MKYTIDKEQLEWPHNDWGIKKDKDFIEKTKDTIGDNKAAAATAGAIGAGLGGVALAKKLRNHKKNK